MDNNELIRNLEELRRIMRDVSTGCLNIQHIEEEYRRLWEAVDNELRCRGIENPIIYRDLWEWYERWSSGDLPTYASRRVFVSQLFNPIIDHIKRGSPGSPPEPTGWARVDRTVGVIRYDLERAKNEEQFQAIGLLCREALISLAHEVYSAQRHPSTDGTVPSQTDVKRMLTDYISFELRDSTNEEARKFAIAAINLALALQHRRTANFKQAAMCMEATIAVVNIIAIVSGQRYRDPS